MKKTVSFWFFPFIALPTSQRKSIYTPAFYHFLEFPNKIFKSIIVPNLMLFWVDRRGGRNSWCISTMKLFQFVRKFYQNIGIDLAQSNQECLFNAKNILPLLCQVQMFISAFGAFLFQVKSISDYGMAFYASITGFAMANFFAILISNRPTIYKLIRSFEEFIDKSKSIWLKFKTICVKFDAKLFSN